MAALKDYDPAFECLGYIWYYGRTKEKLGYIPEKDNVIFSRLLDAGKLLKAKVNSVEKQGSMYKVAIGVYLFDF